MRRHVHILGFPTDFQSGLLSHPGPAAGTQTEQQNNTELLKLFGLFRIHLPSPTEFYYFVVLREARQPPLLIVDISNTPDSPLADALSVMNLWHQKMESPPPGDNDLCRSSDVLHAHYFLRAPIELFYLG